MKVQSGITTQCLALALLALCAAVSAQNTVSSTQAAASGTAAASSGGATASPSASGSRGGSASGSVTSTASSNSTNSTASTTSTTPSTFPIASVPSTGYLAGTAAAPVPGGASGAQGTAASGPNDSHIVSAAQMLGAPFAAVSASILAMGVGVWVLL